MNHAKPKQSGLDKFLLESMAEDEQFRTLFLAEVMKLPISSQLRALRNFRGLSQLALSKRTKLVQPEVARLESAGANPRARTLERLAKGLGARVEIIPENLLPFVGAQQLRAQGEEYFNRVAVAGA
ncbi:MAG: helix-turn-helix transcriptional regulator [Elusimicrobia bacterium]|nr:helix-turn-helix transcriptional regulator [Elusimicrobiota bacterium]